VDFKVASSIYSKPWLIKSDSALEYLDMLEQIKAGKYSYIKKPSSKLKLFANSNSVVTAPDNKYSAKEHPGYEGKKLAFLSISGPLMKSDYCGWYGTDSFRQEFNRISATESIETIVLVFDSPGGQVDGIEQFAEAIAASGKETIALITGTCCSAAYWLASSCKKVIATAQTDITGSIGTMVSFYDRSLYMEENGIILREYYADASKDKNKMMKDAVQGKGRLLIEEMLNPTNDIFLAAVRKNRGSKLNEKETLTGKTFLSAKALEYGLIDEVGSFDKTVNNLLQKQKSTTITMKWINLRALFGLKADTEKVELQDEHLDKVEASLAELSKAKTDLDAANARIKELETAAAENQTKITGLESKVTSLTTERDTLKAENERLGNMDGGKFSGTAEQNDKFKQEKETDAMAMDFQKDLMDKI
jgi:ClpP class serine protease